MPNTIYSTTVNFDTSYGTVSRSFSSSSYSSWSRENSGERASWGANPEGTSTTSTYEEGKSVSYDQTIGTGFGNTYYKTELITQGTYTASLGYSETVDASGEGGFTMSPFYGEDEQGRFYSTDHEVSSYHSQITDVGIVADLSDATTTSSMRSPRNKTIYTIESVTSRVVSGTTERTFSNWVTSSSTESYDETSIEIGTEKIGTQEGTYANAVGDTSTFELTTQIGAYTFAHAQYGFHGYDNVVSVFKPFPFFEKDKDGNQLSETFHILKRHLNDGSGTDRPYSLTWNEGDVPDGEYFDINVDDEFTFSQRPELVTISNNKTERFRGEPDSVQIYETGQFSRSIKREMLAEQNFDQKFDGFTYQTQELNTELTNKSTHEYAFGTNDLELHHNVLAGDIMRAGPKVFQQKDTQGYETQTDGTDSAKFTYDTSTKTIQSLTLLDGMLFFNTTNRYLFLHEQDAVDGRQIWFNEGVTTAEGKTTETTIQEASSIDEKTGPFSTDTTQHITEELTSARYIHDVGQGAEVLCDFAQLQPTTAEFTYTLYRTRWASNEFEAVETFTRYKPPEVVTITQDDNGEDVTTYKYTGTKTVHASSIVRQYDTYPSDLRLQNHSVNGDLKQLISYSKSVDVTYANAVYTRYDSDKIDKEVMQLGDYEVYRHSGGQISANYLVPLQLHVGKMKWTSTRSSSASNSMQAVNQTVDANTYLAGGKTKTRYISGNVQTTSTFLTSTYSYEESKVREIESDGQVVRYPEKFTTFLAQVALHTVSTGLYGHILETTHSTGVWQNYKAQNRELYDIIQYDGIEKSDFISYKHGMTVTTQSLFAWFNDTLRAFLGSVEVTRTIDDTTISTYSEYTTKTVTSGNYEGADSIYDGMLEFYIDLEGYDYYVPLVYSDSCGNTTQFGAFVDSEQAGYSGGGTLFGGGGFQDPVYDEFGNLLDPYSDGGGGDSVQNDGGGGSDLDDADREVDCGPYTFTHETTTHLPSMTRQAQTQETITTTLYAEDQFPSYHGTNDPVLFYYGHMWNHSVNVSTADHIYYGMDFMNPNDPQGLAIYPYFYALDEAFANIARNNTAQNLNASLQKYDGHQAIGYSFVGNTWGTLFSTVLRYNHTSAVKGDNFYIGGIRNVDHIGGDNNFNFLAENHWEEVSDAFIDARQDIRIVNYLKTRTFCSGKFAISTPSTSTTGTHIYTDKNALNPAFYYDSEFYKEYLERTECTLTYDGDSTDRENWYLSTSSQAVSELIEGEDGIYRPFYESGTTGTQQWFFDTREATNTTILIGSFEIFPKASQYQITGFGQSHVLTKPTCCPCVQTSDTYKDAQLSQLENVVMADDLTVGFSGICTFVSETSNADVGSYEVPIYLKTKNLTQGAWGAVETISVGTHTMHLSNMALSYDRPWMLVGHPYANQGVIEVSGKKYMNPNVFISQKEAIELHSYTGRYGQIANISKDEFANRHSHSLVVNPNGGIREDFIGADSVDLRVRRGNLPLGERFVQVQYTQFEERQELNDFEDIDRPQIQAEHGSPVAGAQGGAGRMHEVGSYASQNNWLKLGYGTAHTDAFIMFPQPERGDEIDEAFEGPEVGNARRAIGAEKIE